MKVTESIDKTVIQNQILLLLLCIFSLYGHRRLFGTTTKASGLVASKQVMIEFCMSRGQEYGFKQIK